MSERRAGGRRLDRGTFALGRTRRGTVCRVPLGSPGHGVHSLILGATGAGKTVTTTALLEAHGAAGQGAIVLDPKGDEELRRALAEAAAATGVGLSTWSPDGPAVYNPIARGNPTEIADKCLAAHVFTEPHYRTATQRLLGHALETMRAAGLWPPTLSSLVAHMDPERLDALASTVGGTLAERTHEYVDGLDPRRVAELGGGRDRLAVLVESELGPRLDPALGEDGAEEIDLAWCLDRGEVALLRLDADRYPEASRLLAAALVIDLAALAAGRQDGPAAGVVAIDEFGALAAEHVSRLFARARGAGISLLLGRSRSPTCGRPGRTIPQTHAHRAGALQRLVHDRAQDPRPRLRRTAGPHRRHRAGLDDDGEDRARPARLAAAGGDADPPA